jgi:hypothetical protein
VNGESEFDFALDADVPTTHDRVPPEIVEPLLARLGYPPPPLAASFAGSTALAQGEQGTWWSTSTGGVTPYDYLWEYCYPCPAPPPCTGKICTESSEPTSGPTCGVWEDIGTSSTVSHAFTATGTVEIRLIVWDDASTVRQTTNTVVVSNSAAGGASATVADAPLDAHATTPSLPDAFDLDPATPNPFSGATTIRFAVASASTITLIVYDALGRVIGRPVNEPMAAGWYETRLDAASWPAGTYLVRMEARGASGTFGASQRITRLR